MKKYYYKEGDKQMGPLALKDLKGKGITAGTPIWYDPLPKWTTAAEVPELNEIVNPEVAAAAAAKTQASVKKYFYKTGASQFGPLSMNDLKTKNISPDTPVWYDPLPKWTTAKEVNELKSIIISPVIEEDKEEPKLMEVAETVTVAAATAATIELKEEPRREAPVQINEPVIEKKEAPVMVSSPVTEKKSAPVMETAVIDTPVMVEPAIEEKAEPKPIPIIPAKTPVLVAAAVTEPALVAAPRPASPAPATAVKPVRPPRKKGSAWVTYILSGLVLAAAAYFIYQDMNKNKDPRVAGLQYGGNASTPGTNNVNTVVNSNPPLQSVTPGTDPGIPANTSTINSSGVLRDPVTPTTTLTTTPNTKPGPVE